MNINDLDTKKTAILFFDMLNGYYHEAEPEVKARMKAELKRLQEEFEVPEE